MNNINISIFSLDGYKLPTTILIPNGQIKGVFLLLHGCPSYKDEWGFYGYNNEGKIGMAEFLCEQGYASIRFNFRGQGQEFSALDMKDLTLSGMINDIEAVYQYALSKFPNSEINIVGTSFAGGLSLLWHQAFEHNISNLFLMCPLLNMHDTLISRNVIGEGALFLTEKAKDELNLNEYVLSSDRLMNRSFINEILCSNVASALRNFPYNVHVFLGTHDKTINYKFSIDYITKNNKNASIYTIENAGHGFGARKDMGYSDFERSNIKHSNWADIYNKMLLIIKEK